MAPTTATATLIFLLTVIPAREPTPKASDKTRINCHQFSKVPASAKRKMTLKMPNNAAMVAAMADAIAATGVATVNRHLDYCMS